MAEQTSQSERRMPNPAELIATLESKYKTSPDKAADELAQAYLANGRPSDALRVLGRLANGSSVDRQLLLAQAWFDSFELDRTAEILKEVQKKADLERNLRAQLLLGLVAHEAGKIDDAKKHLSRAYQLDPNNRRAAELLSTMGEDVRMPAGEGSFAPPLIGFHASTVSTESAGHALGQILIGAVVCSALVGLYYWRSHERHLAHQLVVKGAQMLTAHDTEKLKIAESKFLEALEHHAGNPNAIAALAEVNALMWVDHGVDGAKEKTAQYIDKANSQKNEKVERFSAEVLALYGDGKYEEGEKLAVKVLEKGGVSERLYLGLGLNERGMNKGKVGRDNIRRAQELKSDVPIYALHTGNAYDEDADDVNAAYYWSTAAARNVNYVPAVSASVVARSRKGEDPARLHKELDRLAGLGAANLGKRDLAAIERARAVVYSQESKYNEAVAAADKGLAQVGQNAAILHARGWANLALKKVDDGLRDLEAAHAKHPIAARYLYDLIDADVTNAKYDKALDTLKGVAANLSEDPGYQTKIGDVYRAKGDYDSARATYARALELWEEYPEALLGTGITHWRQKKYEEASKWFERAVDAKQKFPEVYVAVGFMWQEQNVPLKNVNDQLDHAEKMFSTVGAPLIKVNQFYDDVIAMYAKAKGGAPFVKDWQTRKETRRKAAAGGGG
ncbi:MAG: tetratricopeptide repeat protein [Deltaproteobacteria bacterium]|nr:tetratricopeptide repeat protein [Deltaproteobacteria bacterium]